MSSSSSSSSSSPCAACKFLRRKCIPGCIFAAYFPADNPARFIQVHRVFGASNVSKLLNELSPAQREDAVNSLAYEAEARLHDPVFGCVGYISLLQHRLIALQRDLRDAKRELSLCICPGPQNHFFASTSAPSPPPPLPLHHQLQQQMMMVEAQQIAAAAAREQEMLRRMEEQNVMARLMGGGNSVGAAAGAVAFEGSFEEGLEVEEGRGIRVHHDFHQRRRFDDGRSGEGPSSN